MATRATKKASATSSKPVKTAKKRVVAPKKAASKKAPNKAAAKKAVKAAKQASPKKAPTKKAPTSAAAKKAPTQKASAKKDAAKKDAAKKAPPKKASAKKGSAKKGSVKAPSRKAPAKPRAVATEKRKVGGGATGGSAAVDGYVERLESWQREVIQRLRELVRKMAPEAAESIKWGQPVFEHGGPFAYVRPAGSHVTFGFWRGAELDDPSGLLDGSGDRMRHVKIHEADEIDPGALGAFVRQAVALNHRHGNPAAIRRV